MAADPVGRASGPTLSDSIRVHLRFSGARASIKTMDLREWARLLEDEVRFLRKLRGPVVPRAGRN